MSDDGKVINHLFIDPDNLEDLFKNRLLPFQVMGDYDCYFIDRRYVDRFVDYVRSNKYEPTQCVLHPEELTESRTCFITAEFEKFAVEYHKVTNEVYNLVITFPLCVMKDPPDETFDLLYAVILRLMRAKYN